MENKYTRLAKNSGLIFVGNIGSKLLNFIMLPYYTKYLSPSEYGVADLIGVYSMILVEIASCQIQEAIFVFPKGVSFEKQKKYFSAGLSFLCGNYCILTLIFSILFFCLPGNLFFRRYIWYIWGGLILSSSQYYLQQFCRSIDRIGLYSLAGVVVTAGSVFSALILIPRYPTGGMLLITQYIGSISAFLLCIFCLKAWRYLIIFHQLLQYIRKMLKYSLPLVPASISFWAISSVNRLFIEHYCGIAAVGIYALAFRISSVLCMLWLTIGTAWQISLLEEFRKKTFAEYYNQMFTVFAGIHVLALLAITATIPLIMMFLSNKDFLEAGKYIPLLLVSGIISNMAGFCGSIFLAAKSTQYTLYSTLGSFLLIFPANWIGVKYFYVFGGCFAIIACLGVQALLRFYYSAQYVKFKNIRIYLVPVCTIITVVLIFHLIQDVTWKYCIFGFLFVFYLWYLRNTLFLVMKFIQRRMNYAGNSVDSDN